MLTDAISIDALKKKQLQRGEGNKAAVGLCKHFDAVYGGMETERGKLARWRFASSLAAGFDAAVGLRALRGPAWLSGQPRYLWATLREIAARGGVAPPAALPG